MSKCLPVLSCASTGAILESWASPLPVTYQKVIPTAPWSFAAFVNRMRKHKNAGSDVGELPQLEISDIHQG